jgi:hypothetical protein
MNILMKTIKLKNKSLPPAHAVATKQVRKNTAQQLCIDTSINLQQVSP